MTLEEEQKVLVQIVETWRISEKPEYRGFRCAHCQQYKNESWYHWVNTGEFKLPIHLCDDTCHMAFLENRITIPPSQRQIIDRTVFGNSYSYSQKAVKRFTKIVSLWPEYKKPELKSFTCDECHTALDIDSTDGLRKGYHVWWKMSDGKTLAELHFHKSCAASLQITG